MGAAKRERCLPRTQTDILQHLFASLTGPIAASNIIWLRGPAGCGKSTILNTLADYFHRLRRQGAFLFWDRNNADSGEPHRVIHTLAYNLARFHPSFAHELASQINNWPHITASLDSQFQYLLLEPLVALLQTHHFGPIVIVLDALDEYGESESRRQLLNTLFNGLAKLPKFVRVLIASRDEPDIHAALSPCHA